MASRGMELGGDLDNLAYASQDEFDAVLKKFCATKNCRPDTAIRWAMQRALTDEQKTFIKSKFEEYYNSSAGLL
jgi:hypothetical protein